ncbi:hypothetical protein FGD67_03575 [Colwellia sp. M166]|uniref:hypothetical protein n=1 Tax=Colwellia sp. M166 TaxID=2583805 RepID=UPI00211EB4E1|nr:hypothetical protein [Colwellia sp. M166]UUO22387.1 hypothetical protein FGD67_03575 [Colwellia sp. M166]
MNNLRKDQQQTFSAILEEMSKLLREELTNEVNYRLQPDHKLSKLNSLKFLEECRSKIDASIYGDAKEILLKKLKNVDDGYLLEQQQATFTQIVNFLDKIVFEALNCFDVDRTLKAYEDFAIKGEMKFINQIQTMKFGNTDREIFCQIITEDDADMQIEFIVRKNKLTLKFKSFVFYQVTDDDVKSKFEHEYSFEPPRTLFPAIEDRLIEIHNKLPKHIIKVSHTENNEENYIHYCDLPSIAQIYLDESFNQLDFDSYDEFKTLFFNEISDYEIIDYEDGYGFLFENLLDSNPKLLIESLTLVPNNLLKPSLNEFTQDFINGTKVDHFIDVSLSSVKENYDIDEFDDDIKKIEERIAEQFISLYVLETKILLKCYEINGEKFDFDSELILKVLKKQIRLAALSWLEFEVNENAANQQGAK